MVKVAHLWRQTQAWWALVHTRWTAASVCHLLGSRLEPSGCHVLQHLCYLRDGPSAHLLGLLVAAVPPVRQSREEDGRIQVSRWQAATGQVSVTGDDTGFRSRIGSTSGRSSGYLQNTQKEMRLLLLLLQQKNECAFPCDLTSYWIRTSMAVYQVGSMGNPSKLWI
jgi:hypothetical protein